MIMFNSPKFTGKGSGNLNVFGLQNAGRVHENN